MYDRKSGPCRQKASECDERVLHSLCHSTFSPATSALDCRKTVLIVVKKMNIASVSCEVSNNVNDAHHDDGADHDDDAADDDGADADDHADGSHDGDDVDDPSNAPLLLS